jgi:hypothetical protein
LTDFYHTTEKEEKSYLLVCPPPLQDAAALMPETPGRDILSAQKGHFA